MICNFFHKSRGGGKRPSGKQHLTCPLYAVCLPVFLFLSTVPFLSPAAGQTGAESVVVTGNESAQLAVDTEHNIVRIIIEGKEGGRFDKDGLHITGDIDYTGSITDMGAMPAGGADAE